jgi:hypothetical protein
MKIRTFSEESDLILKDVEKAYEKMVKFKKEKNSPLVVFENGKIRKSQRMKYLLQQYTVDKINSPRKPIHQDI